MLRTKPKMYRPDWILAVEVDRIYIAIAVEHGDRPIASRYHLHSDALELSKGAYVDPADGRQRSSVGRTESNRTTTGEVDRRTG